MSQGALAQTARLSLDRVEALPGSRRVEVSFFLDNPERLSALETSVLFPVAYLSLSEITLSDTDLEERALEGFEPRIDNARGIGGATLVFDSSPPYAGALEAGEGTVVLKYVFSVDGGILPGTEFILLIEDAPADDYAVNRLWVDSESVPFERSNGSIQITTSNFIVAADTEGRPGERVVVDFVGINSVPVYGFSISASYDPEILAVQGGTLEDSISEIVGAEFAETRIDPDRGEFIYGVLLDALPPVTGKHIPVSGIEMVFAKAIFTVRPEVRPGTETTIRFQEGLGEPPIFNTFVLKDQSSITPIQIDGKIRIVGDPFFVRGDVIPDSLLHLADVVAILLHVFTDRPVECEKAADVDDDGVVESADAILLMEFVFKGGIESLPAPWPDLGPDPTADSLSCD